MQFRAGTFIAVLLPVSGTQQLLLHRSCLTSAETIRTIRDGEPRTATSTLTQLLTSVGYTVRSVLLYFHSDHQDC